MYLLRSTGADSTAAGPRVQLLGCGTILREVEAAAELLAADYGVAADVWSCPSFTELARDGQDVDRWNLLHPAEPQRISWVAERLGERPAGPVVAATDYMRAFAEQIRAAVPADRRYVVLGTDGFGRSDYRKALRAHLRGRPPPRGRRRAVRARRSGRCARHGRDRGDRPLRHRHRQAQPRPRLRRDSQR